MFKDLALIKKWWKTWGTLPVWSWVRAASLYRAGRFDLARHYYEKGLRTHSTHPAHYCARLDLAYCLFKARRIEDADRHLRYVAANLQSRESFVRLARLQLWSGQSLEAAWTVRRAIRVVQPNTELAVIFVLAVIDNQGPLYLLDEAAEALEGLSAQDFATDRAQTAAALLEVYRGEYATGREQLERLCQGSRAPFDALLGLAEVYVGEGKMAEARFMLRRAMGLSADYPRVLSLMAESYLVEGPFQNFDYALQLSTNACQQSAWLSPREMHVLAKAYTAVGDKMAALILASKAQQAGSRLMGVYRDNESLQELIRNLSGGSLA